MANLYYGEVDSPIGPLLIISYGDEIVRIDYGTMKSLKSLLSKWSERYFTDPAFVKSSEKVLYAKGELDAYFSGEKDNFTFPFTLYGTPFQKQVWQVLYEKISYGETTTYKDIAKKIQNPKAVRAVGGAVNKNPLTIVVPCHRVIGSTGKLIGYNGGIDKKEYLLTFEKNNAS